MTGASEAIRLACRCQSGTSAVEFAIICLPLILVSLGIIEFGRALNVRNDLAHAADYAVRKMLIGQIPDASTEGDIMKAAVREAYTGGNPDRLDVFVQPSTAENPNVRTLMIDYRFSFMLPLFNRSSIGLRVTRSFPVE